MTTQSICLDQPFCDAFFQALETDVLAPSPWSIDDRIAAARAEIAGLARCQQREAIQECEGVEEQP